MRATKILPRDARVCTNVIEDEYHSFFLFFFVFVEYIIVLFSSDGVGEGVGSVGRRG